ncbi:hypothetical protein TNIN_104721 [Trichonephila inaurata madagascariensis]|uniref:Uncharacterized protein n=1 Tax=Trichonephila inaurata madagascariensis TaxID=2747483 RepID=A0A8X7BXM0_9ARAC|nr:hypothetical protein TNIN_104721 [Trichonephila inaurata madagascariensis]
MSPQNTTPVTLGQIAPTTPNFDIQHPCQSATVGSVERPSSGSTTKGATIENPSTVPSNAPSRIPDAPADRSHHRGPPSCTVYAARDRDNGMKSNAKIPVRPPLQPHPKFPNPNHLLTSCMSMASSAFFLTSTMKMERGNLDFLWVSCATFITGTPCSVRSVLISSIEVEEWRPLITTLRVRSSGEGMT